MPKTCKVRIKLGCCHAENFLCDPESCAILEDYENGTNIRQNRNRKKQTKTGVHNKPPNDK